MSSTHDYQAHLHLAAEHSLRGFRIQDPLRKIDDTVFLLFAFKGSVRHEFFIFPDQTGTATSSPTHTTAAQTDINIVNTMLWIPVIAETDEEIKKCIQDNCILVCQANGKTYFKKPA